FTLPNISCKIKYNPYLYKIAYYSHQKKIINIPPPPLASISNTTTSAFAPPNSNYPQPNPVRNSFTNMPQCQELRIEQHPHILSLHYI
ncbi:Bgt-51522, partial [Blumeria graminis f. sp. tritici]